MPITFSIVVCIAAFFVLLFMLRSDRVSLGLPIAYLTSLLLIHVPGAFAHTVGQGLLFYSDFVETGIGFTAIGTVCFVVGVWLARRLNPAIPAGAVVVRNEFSLFCLLGGWFVTYGLSFLGSVSSLGAALDKGGTIWMLGVLLSLRAALQNGNYGRALVWTGALMVYPSLMLLLGGFLSYGSTAMIIVCNSLAISVRSQGKVLASILLAAFVGLSVFVNYFANREAIRRVTWSGASFEQRVDVVVSAAEDFSWFDPANDRHLVALNERLNQNYFVGLAAARIDSGFAHYLYGRSLWEGLIALVPRAIWPDKPVFGGSPAIVMEMTGLELDQNTSFGVGNVMEFHINYGLEGVIIGFVVLGWLIGTLDRKAALAEQGGDLGRTIVFFLPAVALIQPNGSMVELVSGSAAALAAAFGWSWGWKVWGGTRSGRTKRYAFADQPRLPGRQTFSS